MYNSFPSTEALDHAIRTAGTCAGGPHDLQIEHLQLHKTTTEKVKLLGPKTISQLAEGLAGKTQIYVFFLRKDIHCERNARSLINLANVCKNGKFEWRRYWESIGQRFSFLAMKLDDIEVLHGVDLDFDISHLNLGKAEFLIRKSRITTCSGLIEALSEGLPVPTGFGANKIGQLAQRMIAFLQSLQPTGGQSSLAQKAQSPDQVDIFLPTIPQISDATGSLDLEAIHLGTQVPKLKSIGVNDVGALLKVLRTGLPQIWSLGRKSQEKINNAVKALKKSLNRNGDVDWHQFASACGHPVIPSPSVEIPDGNAFLSILPEVTSTVARDCFDKVESAALQERLNQQNATTLETLGQQFGLTRERIRQKQMIVLNSISAALLDGNYADMGFRFSEQFSSYWRRAASHFGEIESLGFHDFIDGLAAAWKVDSSQLLPHIPLIYCVLTKESSLPAHYKFFAKIPASVFNIVEIDAVRSVDSLHPSRALSRICVDGGLTTLGDLVRKLRDPENSLSDSTRERLLSEVLQHLVIEKNNRIDWDKYYSSKGIKFLPHREVSSVEDFADGMTDSILEFASHLNWDKATEIIQLRCIPGIIQRKTLKTVAEMLGIHGPTVSLIEKTVLGMINDAIFRDDYADRQYRFQARFVEFFKEAQRITGAADSNEYAASLLRNAWNLDSETTDKIISLLRAIIKLHPPRYPGKRKDSQNNQVERVRPAPQSQPKTSNPVLIKLRGFRSVF